MEKYIDAAETHRRPAPSAPTRCPRSRSKSSTTSKNKNHPPPRSAAPSKPATASIATASTTSASACPASAPRTPSRSTWASGWMASFCKTMEVETKPSKLVYFDPYSEEQMHALPARRRPRLPRRLHRRRFRQRPLRQRTPTTTRRTSSSIRITFVGPFPSKVEKRQPQEDPDLRSRTPGRPASKRSSPISRTTPTAGPVTKPEVASLMKFVAMAKAEGQSAEQGIQLAIEAMLVSPHFLFRIERDPDPPMPPGSTGSPMSNWRRA